jgi:septal ring factor EnvC (AmiA/AmiB activator)
MVRTSVWLAVAMVALTLTAVGCFSYKSTEPLVVMDGTGYGTPKPDTTVQPTDSEQVQQLKAYIARLEHKLADARDDTEKEKAKRKKIEKERDALKDQVEELEKVLKKKNK